MEYKITIDQNKEREFVKLLKAWQKLELIKDFEASPENQPSGSNWTKTKVYDSTPQTSAQDFVSQYRDLVD